jgi:hypothetical protein
MVRGCEIGAPHGYLRINVSDYSSGSSLKDHEQLYNIVKPKDVLVADVLVATGLDGH